MLVLYNTGIRLYRFFISLAALSGNEKAKLWITGRKNWKSDFAEFKKQHPEKTIWFHCASLGEFEQGRPVIDRIKKEFPAYKIVLSFFSPSGYEIRKNYPQADRVFYLPLDTKRNAEEFIALLNPHIAFFVKYEYWYHFLHTLSEKKIPVFFISCNFRTNHIFFRSYGKFFKKMLSKVTRLFVQNKKSAEILSAAGIHNFEITGDTRFDRVKEISANPRTLPEMESFCKNSDVLIGGSTWPEDEDILLSAFIILPSSYKLIIVPHDINSGHIQSLLAKSQQLAGEKNVCLYSAISPDARVVIVDTIGLLSSLYKLSQIAWIGGGYGAGIHNTLEAAAYGIPVLFGPNYKKFNEAFGLIDCGAAYSASTKSEAIQLIETLAKEKEKRMLAGKAAISYISNNIGATDKIMLSVKPYLVHE